MTIKFSLAPDPFRLGQPTENWAARGGSGMDQEKGPGDSLGNHLFAPVVRGRGPACW